MLLFRGFQDFFGILKGTSTKNVLNLRNYFILTASVVALGHGVTSAFPLPEPIAPPVVEPVAPPKPETVKQLALENGSPVENIVVEELQERGITDKNAVATILGNIKQESKFHPNICEGGHRVQYQHCYSGGYGLIQWTTSSRYRGLGNHAWSMGLSPSSAQAQISYIFTESEWKYVEKHMKKSGGSINFYMDQAYYWLGWGIHGDRTAYAHNYADRLQLVDVPVDK